jgi:hypothetical protein
VTAGGGRGHPGALNKLNLRQPVGGPAGESRVGAY